MDQNYTATSLDQRASATVTVVDYTGLSGETFTIDGNVLTEGVDWTAATDNDTTATSLASAIDGVSGFTASAAGAVVTIYNTTPGTAGNAKAISTSDATDLTLSGATLADGVDATYTDDIPGHEISGQEAESTINVTAFTGDTTYTLDVTPQYSYDKVTWFDQPAGTSFTQVTNATSLTHSETVDMQTIASFVRHKIVLGGNDPVATFTVQTIIKT